MPALYDKLGIRFEYPDNWMVDESDALAGNQSVTVYSPSGAFWSIAIHPHEIESGALLDTAVAAMRAEYDELDAEEIRESVAGHDLPGYNMNFYCLDLTNTACAFCAVARGQMYLIFWQAEDREFASLEAVFRAITHSLLSEGGVRAG